MDPVQYSSSGTMIVLHSTKWGKYSQCPGTDLCSVLPKIAVPIVLFGKVELVMQN